MYKVPLIRGSIIHIEYNIVRVDGQTSRENEKQPSPTEFHPGATNRSAIF